MSDALQDRKNKIAMLALGWLCKTLVAQRFPKLQVEGLANIPQSGPFLLLANHTSRWDALVIHNLLRREANYMTHPNELKGLQGRVLPLVGAFPADRSLNMDDFIVRQALAGEPLVIFPEGGVFRDRQLHPFKRGTAHIILRCQESGINLPVVPVAIEYTEDGGKVVVSPALEIVTKCKLEEAQKTNMVSHITQALHEKMDRVRQSLQAQLSQSHLRPAG